MNNYISTVDLHTDSKDMTFSASEIGRESIGIPIHQTMIGGILGYIAKTGIILAVAVSPATATPDIWFSEKRRRDTSTVAVFFEGVIARRISFAEARRIAQKILEQAERKRIEFAEWEASRGIQWEEDV